MKAKVTLSFVAFMEKGNVICNTTTGEKQEITIPLIMTGDEGLHTDLDLKGYVNLKSSEVADIVHHLTEGRSALLLLQLED